MIVYNLQKVGFNVVEEINGYRIFNCTKYSNFIVPNCKVVVKINHQNGQKILEQIIMIEIDVFTKTRDIKKLFKKDAEVYIKYRKKVIKARDEDFPLLDMFIVSNGIFELVDYKELIVVDNLSTFHFNSKINLIDTLRKLIIVGIPIETIDLRQMKAIKHLKLIDCSLKNIIEPKKTLEYCNLSLNNIKVCTIKSKTLILSHNSIEHFESDCKYKYLDISKNPLTLLSCSAVILNISNTLLSTKIDFDSKVLIADHVKNIIIGEFKNLEVLSVNYCCLTKIENIPDKLKIFKARGNFLCTLPDLKSCKHVDVSSNNLSQIVGENIISMNISKNDFSEHDSLSFKHLKHMKCTFNSFNIVQLSTEFREQNERLDLKQIKRIYLNKTVIMFRLEKLLFNIPVTLFVTFTVPNYTTEFIEKHLEKILKQNLTFIDSNSNWIDMMRIFSSYVYSDAYSFNKFINASFVLITSSIFIVRNFGIESVIYNYSKFDIIDTHSNIVVFGNVSTWMVFPVFVNRKLSFDNKKWIFSCNRLNMREIFDFLNLDSPLSIEFMILNSRKYFDSDKPIHGMSIQVVNSIRINTSTITLNEAINKKLRTFTHSLIKYCGIHNIDFGYGCFGNRKNIISRSEPVFVFMRVLEGSTLEHSKYNISCILEFYSTIFGGRIIEKSLKLYILGFENALIAIFWSLRAQKALQILGIEVCIGISGGVVFRTEEDGVVIYGGPAFNKISRIADLGVGIFSDSCITIFHPHISKVSQGSYCLKGFKAKVDIYSIHYNRKIDF